MISYQELYHIELFVSVFSGSSLRLLGWFIISYQLSWRLSYCFRGFGFTPDIIRAPPHNSTTVRAAKFSSQRTANGYRIIFFRPHSTYSFVLFRSYKCSEVRRKKLGKSHRFFHSFMNSLDWGSAIGFPPMISHCRRQNPPEQALIGGFRTRRGGVIGAVIIVHPNYDNHLKVSHSGLAIRVDCDVFPSR